MGVPYLRCVEFCAYVITIVIAGVITTSSADADNVPFQSQFPSDVIQRGLSSPISSSGQFQYLYVTWLRQQRHNDVTVVSVSVACLPDHAPRAVWVVNGKMIDENDPLYPQTTRNTERPLFLSITFADVTEVTSLRLLLSLHTIETETEIQLQSLDPGKTILEHGTDVALALDLQENVTATTDKDLVFLTRFFAEDLPEGSFQGLHVMFVQEGLVTSSSLHPEALVLRPARKKKVPASLRQRFDSALDQYFTLRLKKRYLGYGGVVMFSADYSNNAPCRLFGGQHITRRVFVTTTNA